MASGVYAVAKSAVAGPVTGVFAALTLGVILATKINPVFVILGGGMVGAGVMAITHLH